MLIPRNPYPHSLKELVISKLTSEVGNDLEEQAKFFIGTKNSILTDSGRFALFLSLKSHLKRNEEIIVPAFTCNVILGALKAAGIKPLFADVDRLSLNMEVQSICEIEDKITDKTRAILATHQFGYPCEIDKIVEFAKERDLLVIEDAAPAFGAIYKGRSIGTFGDISFFSFETSKVISTIHGGIIVTDKEELTNKISSYSEKLPYTNEKYVFSKSLVDYFILHPYLYACIYSLWRYFSKEKYSKAQKLNLEEDLYSNPKRMSDFQINLGNAQIQQLQKILATRRKSAKMYIENLSEYNCLNLPQRETEDKIHTYARFPFLIANKYEFHDRVRRKGIDLGFTFSYTLPQYFSAEKPEDYPNAKYIADHILNIPITRNPAVNKRIITTICKELDDQEPHLAELGYT